MSTLTLTIMNHTFEIPCEENEKVQLIEAATMLEDKLDQLKGLRGESKVIMVALNLCYDYLQMKNDTLQYCLHLDDQIDQTMQEIHQQSQEKT